MTIKKSQKKRGNIVEVIVGTRGSKLALTQTNWVIEKLREKHPHVVFKVKIIKTKGDLIQNVALDKIGDKGLFVKEIEEQLLKGQIDIAIHSMKDMPSDVTPGLMFSKTPVREDRRDALVLKDGIKDIKELPQGATIGTGSKRRKYQLLEVRPDLNIVPIRGNIDTRIGKIETENLDGVVLAAAGLRRAGMAEQISYYIPEELVVPAPAQGALGVQIRAEDERIYQIVQAIECPEDEIEVQAERAFLKGVDGSCHIPIGASAKLTDGKMKVIAVFGDEEGKRLTKKEMTASCKTEEEAKAIGMELARQTMEEMSSYEG